MAEDNQSADILKQIGEDTQHDIPAVP